MNVFNRSLLVTAFNQVLNLGSGALIARALSPAERGDVGFIIIGVAFLVNFLSLGVPESAAFFSAKFVDRDNKVTVTKVTLYSAMLSGAVTTIIIYAAYYVLSLQYDILALWSFYVLATVFPYAVLFVIQSYMLGTLNYQKWDALRVSISVLYIAILLIFYFLEGLNTDNILVASALSVIFTLALSVRYVWAELKSCEAIDRVEEPKGKFYFIDYIRFALSTHVANLAYLISERIEYIVVFFLFTKHEFGVFIVAVTISRAILLMPKTTSQILFSRWSAHFGGNLSKADSLKYHFIVIFLMSAFFCLIVYGLSDEIVVTIFGVAYAEASPIMVVLAFSFAFSALKQPLISYLKSQGRVFPVIVSEVTSVLFLVFFVALDSYGDLVGFSILFASSQLVSLFVVFAFLYRLKMANNVVIPPEN